MSIDEVKSVKHSENLFVQNSINSGELEAVLLQVLLNFSPLPVIFSQKLRKLFLPINQTTRKLRKIRLNRAERRQINKLINKNLAQTDKLEVDYIYLLQAMTAAGKRDCNDDFLARRWRLQETLLRLVPSEQ